MERDNLISEIQQFDEEMGREHLAHAVGLKDEVNFSAIFTKHASLFSKPNIALVKALLNASMRKDTKHRNLLLYDYLVSGYIGNELKELGDKASNYESKAKIKANGKTIPFRHASVVVMNEPNRKKRQNIVDALKAPKAVLTKYSKEAQDKEYALLKMLTGKDYVTYYSIIKEMDYDAFADDLRTFLAETTDIYLPQLHEAMTSIKVPLDDIQKHDLGFYLRAHKFDKHFPKSKLLQTLKNTLSGMGFTLSKQKQIHVDAEERPTKVPRAFCSPLLIPQEIHLVLKPHGGQEDYQTILHEAGHSEHFANTRDDLAYELKHMGSHAVSETYAFLFEYLVMDKDWLGKRMPTKTQAEFLSFLRFTKLFFLRRYSGKVLYELQFHRNDLRVLDDSFRPTRQKYASGAEMYADILSKSTGVKYTPDDYLLDMDSGFYSADYVRAWMFEVQLRNTLKEKFGVWFKNKKAGSFLKKMWASGSSGKSQDELAKELGHDKVDKNYLINELMQQS